jgi:hypothetical protein
MAEASAVTTETGYSPSGTCRIGAADSQIHAPEETWVCSCGAWQGAKATEERRLVPFQKDDPVSAPNSSAAIAYFMLANENARQPSGWDVCGRHVDSLQRCGVVWCGRDGLMATLACCSTSFLQWPAENAWAWNSPWKSHHRPTDRRVASGMFSHRAKLFWVRWFPASHAPPPFKWWATLAAYIQRHVAATLEPPAGATGPSPQLSSQTPHFAPQTKKKKKNASMLSSSRSHAQELITVPLTSQSTLYFGHSTTALLPLCSGTPKTGRHREIVIQQKMKEARLATSQGRWVQKTQVKQYQAAYLGGRNGRRPAFPATDSVTPCQFRETPSFVNSGD